ncbi:hypothetical protein CPB86DRAFT_816006 [Serendipita vermifera]|nr:hypothetical protein CPB86DRAFT_816006 [Serendipita vermifera]
MSYPNQRHIRSTGSIPANANRTNNPSNNNSSNRGFSHTPNPNAHLSGVNGSPSTSSTRVSSKNQAASTGHIPNEGLYPPPTTPGSSGSQTSFNLPSASPGARNGGSPTTATSSTSGYQQQPAQVYTTPTREFLVNVEIWSSSAALAHAAAGSSIKKIKAKSPRTSRPSSIMLSGSVNSTSQDDLNLTHSLSGIHTTASGQTLDGVLSSNASTMSKKTGISNLFAGGGGGAYASSSTGAWRSAVCKLSGEGAALHTNPSSSVPPNSGAPTTGSALLTIYSSDDNTLQHIINVHKLTSTDVRTADRSLFNRPDVLAIWGHPAAMSLSTNPTLEPIYLAFSSSDVLNTWLVLLRSYTSPEVYGRLINPEQGGLYRMWRQIELVVVQTRGAALNSQQKMNQLATTVTGYSSPPPTTSPARLGSAAAASTGAVSSSASKDGRDKSKASNIVGGIFGGSKEKEREFVADGPGSLSRPGTATESPAAPGGEIIPLGLTNSHTPSINTNITSVTASSNGTISSGTHGGELRTPGTPTTTNSMKSWSTTSLSASVESGDVTSPSHQSHSSPYGNTATTSMNSAREKERKEKERKEREKREREREKEREKKEKEREKERRKALHSQPGLFAEILLDGEVCGRTTIRKPPLPSLNTSALHADHGSPEAGPEWFEQFLFGDLPSFGNMIIALWRLPEAGKKEKEGDGEKRPRSAGTGSAGATSIIGGTTSTGSGGGVGSTTSSSHHNLSTVSSIGVSSTHSNISNLTDGTTNAGRGRSNPYGVIGNTFGAAKGAVFVGCVEISLPHFSRGEWVEGFWPVYAHANTMGGGNGAGGIGSLGMGVGTMGLGGMSGIGGVAGALVQVGEMKLRIKVDEEIILPSRAYRNVLDALEKRNYLDVLSDLDQKLKIDQQLITPHIVTLAVARNRLLHDIVELAEREINSVASSTATNTLFRGNTVLTKTMELAMAWYGKKFLEASVGPVIRRMIAEKVEIEVDPSKLKVSSSKRPSTKDSFRPSTKESMINTSTSGKDRAEIERELLQEQGVRALEYWCNELWNQIYVVRMECPIELRRLFSHVRSMVEKKFGSSSANTVPENGNYNPDQPTVSATQAQANIDMLPWRAISSFVFLRFIVPAILHPHLFGLCPGMPSGPVVRSLTILAKCTQSLANLNPTVPPKEEYMRGIKPCLERYNPTMVDYLKCVSSLPDAWSPLANSSSFLSGPDKHDRLYVINSLRERLTGRGAGSIPTLWKDAIPLLPYALDVPKHLAILSSTVVRNAKSTSASGIPRSGNAAGTDDLDWSLTTFSGLCFDVEAQALKSVATLAQGAAAASSGAFGNPVRSKRPSSVSSGFGYYQQGSGTNITQQSHEFDSATPNRPGSSRGVTPTGPPSGSSPNVTTPTQKHMPPRPWSSSTQLKRPSSARSITTPAPPSPHNTTPPMSSGSKEHLQPSPHQASVQHLPPPAIRKSSARPSTAPSPSSVPFAADYRAPRQDLGIRTKDLTPRERDQGPETPISANQFQYGPPSANSNNYDENNASSPYHTPQRAESENFVPFHYPTGASRHHTVSEGSIDSNSHSKSLAQTPYAPPPGTGPSNITTEVKKERRSSKIKDFMKRPSTSSGAFSSPSPSTSQRPRGAPGHSSQSSAGDDMFSNRQRSQGSQSFGRVSSGGGGSGSISANSNERYAPAPYSTEVSTSQSAGEEKKKKKGLFGWLGKK